MNTNKIINYTISFNKKIMSSISKNRENFKEFFNIIFKILHQNMIVLLIYF